MTEAQGSCGRCSLLGPAGHISEDHSCTGGEGPMTQTIISPPPLGDKQDLPQETHKPTPPLTPRTPGNRRQDVTLASEGLDGRAGNLSTSELESRMWGFSWELPASAESLQDFRIPRRRGVI